ncbi:CdiA family toxin C-terminal domain-containing protein [Bacillus pseudomycoides]|uniref:CdiA family toxin C-terminal domain-containing protein n=1 Tax=Bacillus pseudomycoides TaxID=64104 RepID=UPI0015CF050D|nr:CdiA family toxin C-terminal domain-containing protein [Bacillus pseudomycoides]
MDVSYKPKDWVDMNDGLNQITKDTFVKLNQANGLLKDVQERVHDLDSDGSIYFHHKDQTETIAKLHVAYTTLQKYCDDAGGVVYDHIDKPFVVTMDQFAQKMRDLSIKKFETTNRIGSTTTTTVPGSNSYGSTPQTITTTKPKITVDDIFKDSHAFDKVLHAEYEEWKRKDPNMKLDYEEYRKRVPSTRGFEYRSIEDEQKQLEAWRDFGLGVLTVGAMFICPPLGVTASLVFGGLQVKSAHDGEDWGTHRKLSQGEKVERYVFGVFDIASAGAAIKGFKAFGSFGKLQEEATSFNPNQGENMVQSWRDGKNITLDRMRLAGLKAEKYGNEKMYQLGGKMAEGADYVTATLKGVEAAEDGTLIGKQAGPGKVTEWVNTRHAESSKFMDGKIQGVEASLAERVGNVGGLGKEASVTQAQNANRLSGEKLPAEGVSNLKYREGHDKHLIEVEDIVWKKGKGIVGGHNLDHFENAFKSNGWDLNEYIISKQPHPTVDGIYQIEYKLPAKDAAQNYVEGQYKKVGTPKTVYDPSKISDSQIIEWGKEAMENGVTNGRVRVGVASNGLKFTGYIDEVTGEIKNFHPSF